MEMGRAWWQQSEGARIEAATLDIERFHEGLAVTQMRYEIPQATVDELNDDRSSGFQFDLADRGDLWGCTVRLNFRILRSDGVVTSVSSPVIVDP
jgi:hypothetical protein